MKNMHIHIQELYEKHNKDLPFDWGVYAGVEGRCVHTSKGSVCIKHIKCKCVVIISLVKITSKLVSVWC